MAIPNPYGAMLQTYRLGEARAALGELETAYTLLSEAHAKAVELRRERMTRRTGFALAGVLCGLGRGEEAWPLYEQSLQGARGRGSGFDQARVHDAMTALAETEGRMPKPRNTVRHPVTSGDVTGLTTRNLTTRRAGQPDRPGRLRW